MATNTISRIITSILIAILGLWFIVFLGFIDGPKIDYIAIGFGLFFVVMSTFIFFNKKEDEIEKIKDNNKDK